MTILVIDLSYFVFHRFYATKSYVKISKQTDSISCTFDDLRFTEIFTNGFRKDMEKLAKKFTPREIYLSKDCSRIDIWRNSIYKDYKSREQQSDFDPRAFRITMNEILPQLMEDYRRIKIRRTYYQIPMKIISYDECEADDICYVLCKRIFLNEQKVVITGDHDYLQLIDERTEVYDLKLNSLRDKSIGTASEDLIYKILTGDKSDNIPSLCSKKNALSMIQTKTMEEIECMYKDNSNFNLNRALVDMREIPQSIIKGVIQEVNLQMTNGTINSERLPDTTEIDDQCWDVY